MFLSAYVRDKQTKQTAIITNDYYDTKSAFKKDLIANGYTVIRISNNQDLKAQDYGYTSLGELKNLKKKCEQRNATVWKKELEKAIKDVESVNL